MTEQNLIPPSEEPVKIRWLNAAEQNPTIPKPIAQHVQIKTNKQTAPSVINKPRTKTSSASSIVRFAEQPTTTNSVEIPKGFKDLNPEDKLKIANLIKELARLSHEKELVENKLEHERQTFQGQMKSVLTDYDKLMKDNQKLLERYNQTKSVLTQYEKKSQPTANEFPNPQRSSTPINVPVKEQPVPSRSASSLLTEQFHLKQLMMEKQLELLHKQQQVLEREFQQRTTANSSIEQVSKSTSIQTTTRATSPIKRECKTAVVERATSPVKQPTPTVIKIPDKPTNSNRSIQTQRYNIPNNDEDLLILSLNESVSEKKATPRRRTTTTPTSNYVDCEEQNLLKDIFFIC